MGNENELQLRLVKWKDLRYGENPHQKAAYYIDPESKDPLALHLFKQVQGKELSFNNLLDADGAIYALSQLGENRTACVVVKHTNPCGAAYGINAGDALNKAWQEGDYEAAFGGIIAINRRVGLVLADSMLTKRFFEILLAPEISEEALKLFSRKEKIRVLVNPALYNPRPSTEYDFKKIRGGWLRQEPDLRKITREDLKVVTEIVPTEEQIKDLLFAWKICKATKSNTITIARNETLIANGAGQQKRVGCCDLAVMTANKLRRVLEGAVAASDGFFPKSDAPKVLIRAGIKAIIQPGGSPKGDKESIALCNKYGVAMVFTGGIRCFRH